MLLLCPGQGAQHVGMGRNWFDRAVADGADPARAVFEQANAVLGFDLASVCFFGPEEELNRTDVSQPGIFTTSLAAHAAATAEGTIDASADFSSAGLSLGEYTALCLAGVFDAETGLRLVRARGQFMQEAAENAPGGMVSLLGGDEAQVTELCQHHAGGGVLVPANFNAPGQIVVSGDPDACGRVAEAAALAGLRAIPLKVAGAFHSPLMRPAAEKMAGLLESVEFRPPSRPVWSNVTASPHGSDVAEIKRLLVRQVVEPVRWDQTMRAVLTDVSLKLVELPPGRVLTGLVKKLDRRREIVTLG